LIVVCKLVWGIEVSRSLKIMATFGAMIINLDFEMFITVTDLPVSL